MSAVFKIGDRVHVPDGDPHEFTIVAIDEGQAWLRRDGPRGLPLRLSRPLTDLRHVVQRPKVLVPQDVVVGERGHVYGVGMHETNAQIVGRTAAWVERTVSRTQVIPVLVDPVKGLPLPIIHKGW